jgi:hypothetical protein
LNYRLYFQIDSLPKMPNQILGSHWRTRSEHARLWKRLVWAAIANKKPRAPLQRATVTLARHSSVEPDDDGMRGSFKPVLDALVQCGVLVDDKRENIGSPICFWVKAPPKKGRIVVIVEQRVEGHASCESTAP